MQRKMLIVDYEKCVGCGFCEMACAIQQGKTVSSTKSMIGLVRFRDVGIIFPMVCQQCLKPLCADSCPTGALSRNEETGAMVVDPDLCIACKMCTVACPLAGIFVDFEVGHAVKCNLCNGDPLCVKVCGYGALTYTTLDEAIIRLKKEAVKKLEETIKKIVF